MSWLRRKPGEGVADGARREGWRSLIDRGGTSLTRYVRAATQLSGAAELPSWAVLPGDAWETAQALIVRVEMPGMSQDDLHVRVEGSRLKIRGEKHSAAERGAGHYHLMERAFGRFERTIPLPPTVEPLSPEVSCRDGVVTIILRKKQPLPPAQPSGTA